MSRLKSDRINLGLAVCGLHCEKGVPKTAREIAAYCGCSYQRIQQIEARALRKIRAALYRDKVLREELFDHGFNIK